MALVLCFAVPASAQQFTGVRIVPYGSGQTAANADSLLVEKVEPEDLDHIIQTHDSVLVFLYKPYCPGLVKHFADDVLLYRHCLSRGIYIAFVAVAEEQLQNMPARVINKHHLSALHCYVINEQAKRSA